MGIKSLLLEDWPFSRLLQGGLPVIRSEVITPINGLINGQLWLQPTYNKKSHPNGRNDDCSLLRRSRRSPVVERNRIYFFVEGMKLDPVLLGICVFRPVVRMGKQWYMKSSEYPA